MRRALIFSALLVAALVAGAAAAGSGGWNPPQQIGSTDFVALAVNDGGVVAGYVMGSRPTPAVIRNGVRVPLALPADAPTYATGGYANGINADGQVAGVVTVNPSECPNYSRCQEAILWQPDGSYALLGFLDGGWFSSAMDVNDDGVVVGAATPDGGTMTAVRWSPDGTIETLPAPEGTGGFSFANAINAAGDIAGTVGQSAVRWSGGTASLLEPLAPGAATWAADINAHGLVVGNGNTTASLPFVRHVLTWSGTTPTDLGALDGPFAGAYAVNDDGIVVGWMSTADRVDHAYAWVGGEPVALGALPGDARSFAKAINARGMIVGSSGLPSPRAVAWAPIDAEALLVDLIAVVDGYRLDRLGTSLHDKLVTALRMVRADKPAQACETMDAFLAQVRAQRGKGLTTTQADELAGRANDVKTVLGC